ncbi:MAG: hypothetical protein AB8B93_19825 [Pseudomonadales bacterium]
MRLTQAIAMLLATLTLSAAAYANGWSNVSVNGQRLNTQQLQNLERQIGSRVAPGAYLVDGKGCWVNLSDSTSGCLGARSGGYLSRHGSGARSANGDWNHYSRSAGMGVGGTGDGCIYTTTGWSNC